jgi:hypothetical protein
VEKAVRLMVGSGLSVQEAYEAVPQLADRGEKVLQNLRKRAREALALLEATAAPPKPAKPRAKKQKKPTAVLPKGKRLRTDQVDAISAQKVEKRQRRSDACTLSCGRRRHTERQSHKLVQCGKPNEMRATRRRSAPGKVNILRIASTAIRHQFLALIDRPKPPGTDHEG